MKKIILISISCAIWVQAQCQSWNITGNAGMNASSNFIGTTDNVAFKIRTKNTVRLTVNGAGKVGIGIASPAFKLDVKGGSINTDSVYRIGGNTVLSANGINNFFAGTNSGYFNNSSLGGVNNTASGYYALYSNTWGQDNTAVGTNALYSTDGSHNNTAVGAGAMFSNTGGSFNTACGSYALNAGNGYQNSAFGSMALYNCTGQGNTASGYQALNSNTTGSNNTASGVQSLFFNTTANDNVAIGNFALTSQSYNPGFTWSSGNVAIGNEALYSNQPISTGTGFYNTAVGTIAMHSNTTGYYNTGIGHGVLYSNTTGYLNTACGRGALFNNTEGILNTASGAFSLNSNITGSYNTANGYLALYSANSSNNTATGYHALYSTTNATRNTAIGAVAGSAYVNSSYNTFVGGYADANADAHFNSSVMGDAATITASSQVRLGDGGVTSIGGFVGWTTLPSDGRFKQNIREDVKGLNFILRLRPVTYTLDVHGINHYIGVNEAGKENIYEEKSHIRYTGFIAQEVESAAKETGFDFSGVDAPKNNKDVYGLRYAEFVVPLVKAVQELSHENENLKSEIEIIKSVLSSEQKQNFDKIKNENKAVLEQNSPNPFNTQTEIKFHLPEKFNSAQLIITDANGKQVRNDILKSSSAIIIKAAELSAGTYSYLLVVDGVNVDSKQMVLTK